MKRLLALSCIFFLTVPSVFSAVSVIDVSEVKTRVTNIKGTVPAGTPSAPAGDFDQKGYVGEIMSRIFDTDGRVISAFIAAFSGIMTQTNNVPKWNGDSFELGTLWDKGGKIGVGNNNPQKTLDITGDINFSGDLYKDGTLFIGDNLWNANGTSVYKPTGRVGIGTDTPLAQLHTTSTARFDGGVMVDGRRAISGTNFSHTAQATNDARYGFFEVLNNSGVRGGYFGYGNGGDRINLHMDNATKLNISGGSVGIGINNPQAELHVNGNIISDNPTQGNHLTTRNYVDDEISTLEDKVKFRDGTRVVDAVYTDGRVGIGTDTPFAQLHTTGTARFDGGVMVDSLRAISSSNASHTTYHSNYGYFEGRNTAGERGFYLGSGNGGNRTHLILDKADKLYIGKSGSAVSTLVGIGTINPQAMLHVRGNIISDNPTLGNHVTTKSYVDDLVTAGVSWKAPVASGSTPTATYGACSAVREGWATYNKGDNAIYLCNGSSWVNIGSTAVIPNATTTSAGKVQIAGDITGTWNNITLKNNVVESANIVDNTITDKDLAAGSVKASEISDGSVRTQEIANETITAEDIAVDAIGQSELAPDSVGNANIKASSVVNRNIAADAAISGTKINPNFGSQTVRTSGNVIGADPTANNHLVTKRYVDAAIAGASSSSSSSGGSSSSSSSSGGSPVGIDYTQCTDFSSGGNWLDAYDGGSHSSNAKWKLQCPKDYVMVGLWDDNNNFDDLEDVKCCKLKGGGAVMPVCSNGQILKHNGTKFICGTDNVGTGSSSSSGGGADTDWTENATTVYQNKKSVAIGRSNVSSGAKLHVQGNIIASSPTAASHVATKKYVDDTISCTTLNIRQGFELKRSERPNGDTGNRYLLDARSAGHRCQELGYDFGVALDLYGPTPDYKKGWCGFSNARTAYYSGSPAGWISTGCTNGSIKRATCCNLK